MVGVPHLTGKQKIYTAVVVLICEPGNIEQRLKTAFDCTLAAVDPQLDLPPELTAEFVKIRNELRKEFLFPGASRQPDRYKWARAMAAKIVAFYDSLCRIR